MTRKLLLLLLPLEKNDMNYVVQVHVFKLILSLVKEIMKI